MNSFAVGRSAVCASHTKPSVSKRIWLSPSVFLCEAQTAVRQSVHSKRSRMHFLCEGVYSVVSRRMLRCVAVHSVVLSEGSMAKEFIPSHKLRSFSALLLRRVSPAHGRLNSYKNGKKRAKLRAAVWQWPWLAALRTTFCPALSAPERAGSCFVCRPPIILPSVQPHF